MSKSGDKEDVVKSIRSFDQYKKFVKKSKKCIVFDSASWCSACTTIKPLYYRIAARYSKYVKFGYCEIDYPDTQLDFSSIPVFVILYKGKEIRSVVGADKDGLKDLVKEIITHDDK